MRSIFISVVICIAACSTPNGGGDAGSSDSGKLLDKVQIVFRQYYGNSHIFIMENLAGRDLVKLRSETLPAGQYPVAYIEDDVMQEMLNEFRKGGFYEHAAARPSNPLKLGGKGEVTLTRGGRTVSIIRRPGQTQDAFDAYDYCRKTALAIYDHYSQFQSTTTSSDTFGVKKTDFGQR